MICPNCGIDTGLNMPIKWCRCGYGIPPSAGTREVLVDHGVGHEAEELIPGWLHRKGCKCRTMARKMDKWGIDGCDGEHREAIENHFVKEAGESLLKYAPGKRLGAKLTLNKAIANARYNAWDGGSQGDWVTVLTTAPRKSPTIVQCVNSLRVAGWEPVVFAEPGSVQTNCHTIQNEQRKGCWHNWLASVHWALENSDRPNILTVQDDSLFHPDTRYVGEQMLWPSNDAGFLSFYTNRRYGNRRPSGAVRIPTKSMWGACALAWPRHVLERLVELPKVKSWLGARARSGKSIYMKRKNNPHLIQNSDTIMGHACKLMGREMWFVNPSPVSHIASTSATGHGGNSSASNRNCDPCADHKIPLIDQVPLPEYLHPCE